MGNGWSPQHPTRGPGKRRKLPQRGPGRSPGRKWISCIFEVRKIPPGIPGISTGLISRISGPCINQFYLVFSFSFR